MTIYLIGLEPSLSTFPCLHGLRNILEQAGYRVQQPTSVKATQSDSEDDDIESIRACRVFLLIVTGETKTSPRYQRAWEQAIDEHKPIIQLVCGQEEVPERLRIYEAIEFTECEPAAVERLLESLGWVHSAPYERIRRRLVRSTKHSG